MTFGARRDGKNDGGYYRDKGELAEFYAISLLEQVFSGCDIEDVRLVREWQQKDVDFIVYFENGHKRIEVKYDKYLGGDNFCFEPLRIRHNTDSTDPLYLGWSIRSEAHLFLMFHEQEHTMYCVYQRDLILGLQRYAVSLDKGQQMFIRSIPTDNKRTTINIYVPQRLTPHTVYLHCGNGYWEAQQQHEH
jgi:hypothetical protein